MGMIGASWAVNFSHGMRRGHIPRMKEGVGKEKNHPSLDWRKEGRFWERPSSGRVGSWSLVRKKVESFVCKWTIVAWVSWR